MNNPIIDLKINNEKYLFLFYKKEETTEKYLFKGKTNFCPWGARGSAVGHDYRGKTFVFFRYVFGFYKDVLKESKNYVVDVLREQDKLLKHNDLFPKEVRSKVLNRKEFGPVDKNYKELAENVDKLFSKALDETSKELAEG